MTINDVMTTQEAGEIWEMPADSIKQVCLGRYHGGFTPEEARKSGRMWLVTRAGMLRVYGEPKQDNKA